LRARLAGEPAGDDADAPDGADGALTARSVRAAADLLEATRVRQRSLRGERELAREALKSMIARMLGELGELGNTTGRFSENVGRYADAIEKADSLESLAGAVREMVGESRAVHGLVSGARERLANEHARAGELQARVLELESELRRLSDEVSTDALTQVANRRGMQQAFEAERARFERGAEGGDGAATLSIGLIDIDNFKKLNDSLGHAAGDVALQSLAARVKEWLRPVDHIARYGGEEFVVLLPATPVDEAQQVLTRLQRQLTASLFMHNGKEVFVTFSAGVTAYRAGEAIEAALERADEGLYEAKRTGKNRTCIT
jgi:diguanylate cyclase